MPKRIHQLFSDATHARTTISACAVMLAVLGIGLVLGGVLAAYFRR